LIPRVVRIGETAGTEIVNMPGSKKKKPQAQVRGKAALGRTPAKKSRKTSPQPAKKAAPAKKVAAKKRPAKKVPVKTRPAAAARRATAPAAARAPTLRTFAEKIRGCEAGTGVWFITAGSVEHATIQRRGGDGAVVIRTDAGATEVVPASNLFETADEARAARYR
jgi:hypothetical protein